jgi:hypothetical protein
VKLLEDVLQESILEALQHVPVHGDDFRDHSLSDEVQELLESLFLEVDSAAYILHNLMVWGFTWHLEVRFVFVWKAFL